MGQPRASSPYSMASSSIQVATRLHDRRCVDNSTKPAMPSLDSWCRVWAGIARAFLNYSGRTEPGTRCRSQSGRCAWLGIRVSCFDELLTNFRPGRHFRPANRRSGACPIDASITQRVKRHGGIQNLSPLAPNDALIPRPHPLTGLSNDMQPHRYTGPGSENFGSQRPRRHSAATR